MQLIRPGLFGLRWLSKCSSSFLKKRVASSKRAPIRDPGLLGNVWGQTKQKLWGGYRLRLALKAHIKPVTGEIRISGEEHIKEILPYKKVIIVTTHISDLDVPIAASKLSKYFNIAITNESVSHSFLGEPSTNVGMRIAGKENFIPIDYKKVEGKKQGAFNPENFKPMKEALDKGKAIIIAGHNPTQKWRLPKGGYGAAYLSDITDNAVILPVTVNIESDEPVGMSDTILKNIRQKPNVSIYINKPIELKKIPGIEDMANIMKKHENGEKLTREERKRFSELKKALQNQSDKIMKQLAANQPNVKKGEYANK
jgi:hypothetical protein